MSSKRGVLCLFAFSGRSFPKRGFFEWNHNAAADGTGTALPERRRGRDRPLFPRRGVPQAFDSV
ncbi:MAG: hypothetical protein C6P37_07980 [Caldibacillus debilis]|uniref:Uncharacterized protein n=1 Tax=Caldibacillus debilis TaxID=301148 RepID=A0A3E0K5G2_9BACI|nr:MAG: hypothetical protein BAA03_08400 [Caldibacillus debilis]REJ28574.1 MAG: hypothetical protein C6P37_07980 [Caldibacillus debilis]REJ29937.1 MAG: hypothetical protein C6W56_04865 [Caldibacillus debilis]